jgi:hypothetical protein
MSGKNRTDGLRRIDERQITGAPMVLGTVTATVVVQDRWKLARARRHPQVSLEAK